MHSKKKPILDYKGVRVFHVWKGSRALSYLYALEPGVDAETSEKPFFDIRELPSRYMDDVVVEQTDSPVDDEDFKVWHQKELEAHCEAIRRAIDGGYNVLNPSFESKFKRVLSRILNR